MPLHAKPTEKVEHASLLHLVQAHQFLAIVLELKTFNVVFQKVVAEANLVPRVDVVAMLKLLFEQLKAMAIRATP